MTNASKPEGCPGEACVACGGDGWIVKVDLDKDQYTLDCPSCIGAPQTKEAPTFGPHTIDGVSTLAAASLSDDDARVMTAPIKLPCPNEARPAWATIGQVVRFPLATIYDVSETHVGIRFADGTTDWRAFDELEPCPEPAPLGSHAADLEELRACQARVTELEAKRADRAALLEVALQARMLMMLADEDGIEQLGPTEQRVFRDLQKALCALAALESNAEAIPLHKETP